MHCDTAFGKQLCKARQSWRDSRTTLGRMRHTPHTCARSVHEHVLQPRLEHQQRETAKPASTAEQWATCSTPRKQTWGLHSAARGTLPVKRGVKRASCILNTYLHNRVHSGITHSSLKVEATWVHQQMNRQTERGVRTGWNITQPWKGSKFWHKLRQGGSLRTLCQVKQASQERTNAEWLHFSEALLLRSAQSCPTLCNHMACSRQARLSMELFQATILYWVAISYSKGSSRSRDRTHVSCPCLLKVLHWQMDSLPPLYLRSLY